MTTEHQLISLLRRAATVLPASMPPCDTDWPALLVLAQRHHVENLLWYALRDRNEVPPEVRSTLERKHQAALFRDAQSEFTSGEVGQALSGGHIPHILLRGAVLKRDYPSSDMRSMSDLDILVRTEGFPSVRRAVEPLGGRLVHSDGGHRTYVLPPDVVVEFHPDLIYAASPVGTAINPGWQYVRPDSGPYRLELTEEGFYLNLLCHLAYHFAKGGTGVRSVLDVWVYRHRHTTQPDRVFVEEELHRAGLLDFARRIEALSEAWFGTGEMTPELAELGDYILASGAYGTEQRSALNAASFSGGGRSAILKRAFYPRAEMEQRFPWLKGRPYLLPAAWCLRAGKAATVHRKQLKSWTGMAVGLSRAEIAAQKQKLARFGLRT